MGLLSQKTDRSSFIENAEMPFILRPIYCMPLHQTWEALTNLTILGDAAHVMPSFAGEGATFFRYYHQTLASVSLATVR